MSGLGMPARCFRYGFYFVLSRTRRSVISILQARYLTQGFITCHHHMLSRWQSGISSPGNGSHWCREGSQPHLLVLLRVSPCQLLTSLRISLFQIVHSSSAPRSVCFYPPVSLPFFFFTPEPYISEIAWSGSVCITLSLYHFDFMEVNAIPIIASFVWETWSSSFF